MTDNRNTWPGRWLAAVLALGLGPGAAMADSADPGWIVATREGGAVQLEVFSKLENGEPGRYELQATKIGPSGKSVSRQTGTIPATHDAAAPLSVSRLSLEPGATLLVELKVQTANGQTHESRAEFDGE
ncbi:curli-like amyloid fiber formation chaperone CsgH [Marivita sp. GX14005]|uniref:curli-like amyloid fiber formation chaperone CsgH n=1 Tax=Marivita sp. GX14005 TaxID=2942276 RepID=UPI0020192A97|nr:curli-like amyloid fiber formation chaperone CsgH [Marivita sp. GX14005]MCL3880772.1 hypothetical protein [Marivita sp. GX14005]